MKHTFSAEEKAMVEKRMAEVNKTLAFIAELHGLQGNLSLTPDGTGLEAVAAN